MRRICKVVLRTYTALIYGLRALAALITLCLALLITVNVLLRKVFDYPLEWAFDFSQHALVYMTFLAAGVLTRQKGHIRVDAVMMFLPARYARWLEAATLAFASLVSAILLGLTGQATWQQFVAGNVQPAAIPVPNWAIWGVMPIGFFMMTLEFAGSAYRTFTRTNEAVPQTDEAW